MLQSNSYLQATIDDLLSFRTANRAVNGNLFVTANTERANSVTCLGENRCLSGELFKNLKFDKLVLKETTLRKSIQIFIKIYLCCASQSVTGFANADVQAKLLDLELAHRIGKLLLAGLFLFVDGHV